MRNEYVFGVSWLVLSRVIQLPLQIVLIMLVTRTIGPDGMGKWAMILASATLLHSVVLNWLHTATVRFGREEWLQSSTMSRTASIQVPWIIFGMLLVVLMIYYNPLNWQRVFFHLEDGWGNLILLSFFGIWFCAAANSLMQVRYVMQRVAIVPVVINLILICVLGGIFFGDIRFGDDVFVIILCLIALPAMTWFMVLCFEYLKLNIMPLSKVDWADTKSTINYAWALIPGFLIGYIAAWGDHFLLQYFFDTPAVGLFHAAYQVFIALLSITFPLITVVFTKLVGNVTKSDGEDRRFLVEVAPSLIILWGICIIPMVTILPFVFSFVVGDVYEQSVSIFTVLCIAIPSSLIASVCSPLFNVQGRIARSAILYHGIMVVINFGIAIALIPIMGVIGAAIAMAAQYIVGHFLYYYDQYRFLKIKSVNVYFIYLIFITFSIGQAFFPYAILPRLLLAFIAISSLIWLSRYCEIVREDILYKILPPSFHFISHRLSWALCGRT